jgi:putative heme-binding domain-containing protein
LLVRSAAAQPLVATTDPLTPAEQQKKFKLPPGFEIELVACEPDIHKPMNMKFDAHGRLWVTHSLEYPFPAKDEATSRDAITVFSDFAADGRAGKVHRFAEHLNIPIGVLPLGDHEAVAWSIPHIYRLLDTNGDGVADERKVMFGPFGIVDTHGNQNAFTRWIDGWVYANHGFNNHSQPSIGGEGPPAIDMHSGNTYRFRPDGSAIEQYSWGQVNPFGLSFDPLGNLYSADCHSRAVTMLLREGYYQSFGKPHDGLGYAPDTTDKDHGGTGIAGVVYSAGNRFPAEFSDVLFVGNVITNRVHCDRLKWSGSSPTVNTIEDFVACDDPWFRPVDLQLGPDGALYIADFYNRIIGHYEVPLTHPGRDRERGRIWRVVYKGAAGAQQAVAAGGAMPDLTKATAAQLVDLLGHANLTVRALATNALIDRFGKEAPALVRQVLDGPTQAPSKGTKLLDRPAQRAHALWVLERTDKIDEPLAKRMAAESDAIIRVHLTAALAATPTWQPWHFDLVRARLTDSDPFVQRAATAALAQHPAAGNLKPLLKLQAEVPAGDAQLAHATKIALRDQLRSPGVPERLAELKLTPAERKAVISLAVLAPNGPAALLIYEEALQGNVPADLLSKALPAAARFVDLPRVDALVDYMVEKKIGDREYQIALLRGMYEGLAQRGLKPTERMRSVLTDLLGPTIRSEAAPEWKALPLAGQNPSASPWVVEARAYQDSQNQIPMISSIGDRSATGEQSTGVLRSPDFILPAKMTFWMCGHNGPLGTPDAKLNYVRLVLDDGKEVARSLPPRSDQAAPFEWNLADYAGQRGHVEVVDGLSLSGFAWLAVSRFEPPVIRVPTANVSDVDRERAAAVKLVGELRLEKLTDLVEQTSADAKTSADLRLASGEALATLKPAAAIVPLGQVLADANQPVALRQKAAELLGRIDRDDARRELFAQLRSVPGPIAVTIASSVAGNKTAAKTLLDEIRAGRASATLLREPTVLDRLRASGVADLDKQVAELTAKLSPADDRIAELLKQRRAGYLAGKFDPEAGRAVFARSVCKNCHRAGDVGVTIGPALDGIGNRGLDRLLEDVLDPNRNVDQAFRTNLIETDAGRILAGFGVREEGQTLVLFDNAGQQVRVPLAEITERSVSALSPMPANVSEVISEQDFYQLLSFLLSQKAKEKAE